MKIGILLIGQTRTFELAKPHILKEFDLGDDIDVDFFCHTWNTEVNFSPFNTMEKIDKRFSNHREIDESTIKQRLGNLNIKKLKIENYDCLDPIYDNLYYPETVKDNPKFDKPGWRYFDSTSEIPFKDDIYFKSLLGQFYSSSEAMKLLQEYERESGEKYDVIVRWRYDLASNHEIRNQELRKFKWTEDIEPNTIYFNIISLWGGMVTSGDHYWYGDAASMKSFTTHLDVRYIQNLRNKILTEFPVIMNENIVIETLMNLKMNAKSKSIGVVPVRPGADPNMNYDELLELANKHEQSKRTLSASTESGKGLPVIKDEDE